MLESKIEAHLVREVEKRGGLCLKLALAGKRGFPDRTVVWPEKYVGTTDGFGTYRVDCRIHFIELKKPGGELSKQQEEWVAELESKGCTVFVLSSMEEVDAYLEENG